MTENMNKARRDVLKKLALGAGGALVLSQMDTALAKEKAKEKAKKLELVKETDPLPKGLGYVADATKAERPDKAGTKGADQLCSNCQFYTKSGAVDGEEVGKCQLFPKGHVPAKAWCKSWIKKAG